MKKGALITCLATFGISLLVAAVLVPLAVFVWMPGSRDAKALHAQHEAMCLERARHGGHVNFVTRDETADGCDIYLPDGTVVQVVTE